MRATFTRFTRWGLLLALASALTAVAQDKISDAEKRLFMEQHLKNVSGKATLQYSFSKKGSYEKNYEDSVLVSVKPQGKAKAVHVDFLSGERKFELPDVEDASGNPVVLSFLERDVREMHRITQGPVNYFRQRVRLALAQDADMTPVTVKLGGKELKATKIVLTPFEDDPRRARFERFSNKTYLITLCDEIPGGVYQMQTILNERQDTAKPGESSVSPMISETLTFVEMKK